MQLAKRMSVIKPSATLAINAKALELKAQGVNVTSLAVGEPDFPTPAHICEAAKKALDDGFTKYTQVPGIPELRKACAGYFERVYGVTAAKPENIIATNGGKQSLYALFQVLLNPGDEVLVPAPYWVSYPEMVVMAEGIPVAVPSTAESGFKVTIADLNAGLTPKTRVLVLNSPSNPTGACYSPKELDAIMEWAIAKNLFVISDEIYDQLVYEPAVPASAVHWWVRYPEQVAICNGLAKSFAMTGWRLGFTLACPDVIKAMSSMQSQVTANVCSIVQKAAVAALNGPFDSVLTMRAAFKRRRDAAVAEIATWPGVKCPTPDGAFYLFLDVSCLLGKDYADDIALCAMLLDKAHVAVVPGSSFGAPGCLRLSYATADEVLMEALARVKSAFFSC